MPTEDALILGVFCVSVYTTALQNGTCWTASGVQNPAFSFFVPLGPKLRATWRFEIQIARMQRSSPPVLYTVFFRVKK